MGGVNIPLEANNLTPQQSIDPLQEQMRAAQLKQSAAQTTGLEQGNQVQALQLKDEQLRRSLAPQYVQKDSSGKITGFDNEGLYGDMLAHGADPATIQAMRMKNVELQKALMGLGDAQLEHSTKIADLMGKSLESIQQIQDEEKKAAAPAQPAPQPATPAQSPASPVAVPVQTSGAPVPIGSAPAGTTGSFAPPAEGSVPTDSEAAIQASAANAPRPIMPGAQKAYHQALVRLAAMGVNIGQLPPALNDESDLEQAEASIGQYHQIHKDQLADQKTVAETHAQEGKGALDQAEAGLKQIELNLAKNATPGSFDQQIDGLKLPPDQSAMLKEQINQTLARGDVPTAKKIVASALENVQGVNKDIAVATNPQIQAGKVAVATAEGKARQTLQAEGVPASGAVAAQEAGVNDPQGLQHAIPANIRPTVMAVMEGRQSPPGSFALKTPYWQNIMNQVYALDPQWNEQRAQLRKAYTTGTQSKEINAINTAMGHVGVLGDAIDALNNGDIRILNSIGNRLGVEVGKDPVTAFKTIVHRVGPELSKAYIGAGGSAGERGADEKDFDPDLGPQQLKTNVALTAKLLRSKIGSLENQWNQNAAPGVQSFQDRFITPEAKQQLDKWSPQGGQAGTAQTAGHQVGDIIVQNGHRFKATKVDANGKVLAADPQ